MDNKESKYQFFNNTLIFILVLSFISSIIFAAISAKYNNKISDNKRIISELEDEINLEKINICIKDVENIAKESIYRHNNETSTLDLMGSEKERAEAEINQNREERMKSLLETSDEEQKKLEEREVEIIQYRSKINRLNIKSRPFKIMRLISFLIFLASAAYLAKINMKDNSLDSSKREDSDANLLINNNDDKTNQQ